MSMYYYVFKYELKRYLDDALKYFMAEWLSVKDLNLHFDHRAFITFKLETLGCFVEWHPAIGRPRKIPKKQDFDFDDISRIYFIENDALYQFKKQFGNGTKRIVINFEKTQDAVAWLSENISPKLYDIYGSIMGRNWEASSNYTDVTKSFCPTTRDVFITDSEKAFEFALRYGVCV
jgi:hypothetical protein